MTQTLDVRDHYLASFTRAQAAAKAATPWLARLREAAMSRFYEIGFPTTDQEDWRFTDIGPIAAAAFDPAAPTAPDVVRPGILDGPLRARQIAFVNGVFEPRFSSTPGLPDGVRAGSLADVLARDPRALESHFGRYAADVSPAFASLNTALFRDGAYVHVPKGCVVADPIHLLFASAGGGEPAVAHPRVLVILDEGAQATIVESYVGQDGGACFTNAVAEIVLGQGAVLDHYRLQRESVQAYFVSTTAVRQGRQSSFASHAITFGGAIARSDVVATLAEGASCALNGLYEATGGQLVDNHTTIDHAEPHGTSSQLYKGVLSGHAHGVFNGKVIVRAGAQKTDATQANKNLLLSDDAVIDTKPELLIHANDVKCKHGATIGQLDHDVLFYLRSRGIGLDAARRLLVHAFSSEILDHIRHPGIRAQLGGCLLTMAPEGIPA